MGLLDFIFGKSVRDDNDEQSVPKNIFISFAIEDKVYRDYLVAQAKDKRSPFTFTDMSVKKKWDDAIWKRQCRKKIKGCDGVIVLLSKNTYHAGGVRWEMKCALQEQIPMIGMHIKKKDEDRGSIPPELDDCNVISWSWENLDEFINNL